MSAAAATAAARQLAASHDDSDRQQHLSSQADPDFTFLRHEYDAPNFFFSHPRSNALLRQDADSHLEDEAPPLSTSLDAEKLPAPLETASSAPARAVQAAASLASLRQDSIDLRSSLQTRATLDHTALVKQCRRLVLRAHRIRPKLDAKLARTIACETVADCAVYLIASAQPIAASQVLRHLLVKLGWSPRSIADMHSPLHTLTTANSDSRQHSTHPVAAATTSSDLPRLVFVTQQAISQLTMAPSASSPRPVRGFQSQHHLDAAVSLVAAMHIAHVPRSTLSQSAVIRAMLAAGHTTLAAHTYAAEVRAWWKANTDARRSRSSMRHQAALIVETGKPSSQLLREITSAMRRTEDLLNRVQPDLWAQLSPREQHALGAKQLEHAECLVDLLRLVRQAKLPLPPTPSASEIAWILSACCRFETTMMLNQPDMPDASTHGSTAADHRHKVNGAARFIRYHLREYMKALPNGQPQAGAHILLGGDPVVRPPISIAVYNQLIHYALSVLKSPPICKEVFQHMTQQRQPPLQPDAVTLNTILRQATTQRHQSLARAVLTISHAENSQAAAEPDAVADRQVPEASGPAEGVVAAQDLSAATSPAASDSRPLRPIIQQIDSAIAQADTYRLAALLQYVTSSGLFLKRFRHEPGHIGVKEAIMRIYPVLNKKRHWHKFTDEDAPAGASSQSQPSSGSDLRPKANRASRHAILHPHVLTAALNLASKAGKTGLLLRVWRLIKRTSLQSALQSSSVDVASKPWKVPVEAATILMQTLASEAARAPKAGQPSRLDRLHAFSGPRGAATRRKLRMAAKKEYARGWNILASVRGRSPSSKLQAAPQRLDTTAEQSEGVRWRAARVLAKREYAFLVHHWQVSRPLSIWRRQRLQAWLDSGSKAPTACTSGDMQRSEPCPDSRFYDALLGVFGRRPGMAQRSKSNVSQSTVLAQLRRGFEQAQHNQHKAAHPDTANLEGGHYSSKGDDQAALSSAVDSACDAAPLGLSDVSTWTTSEMLESVVARVQWNAHGRWSALNPHPMLVRLLLDMEALGLAIPVAYRWVLAHCALAAHDDDAARLLGNDDARGRHGARFNKFRADRVKTRGLAVSRPNAARDAAKQKQKEQKE